jgi:hypothetical protein
VEKCNRVTGLGPERAVLERWLPLIKAGYHSQVKNYRSDPIFNTQPSILPFIPRGGPSLNKKDRSYRMDYRGGAKPYYLYSIKQTELVSHVK